MELRMKLLLFIVFLMSLVGCSKHKVYLIKQWHLSPAERTLDTEAAKNLPQYLNQIDIFQKSEKLLQKGAAAVIAEGCEDKANYLKENFNGWTYSSIEEKLNNESIDSILAPVPLKLYAKHQKSIQLICGDNSELIKKNNLAFSDMKGLSGFFYRLQMYQNIDQGKYNKYLKAFNEVTEVKKNSDPVLLAKNKTLEALNKFKKFIEQRNYSFVKAIVKNLDKDPILIVGGLHIPGIKKLLDDENIDYEVITPFNYPADEEKLVVDLEKALNLYEGKKVVFNQVPFGFTDKLFPFGHLIDEKKLATTKELIHLKGILKDYGVDERVLTSDFDKDGIRDFTISKNKEVLIISAEDNDWDNDNRINLIDNSIGSEELFKIDLSLPEVTNSYETKGIELLKIKEVFQQNNIKLVNQESKHDLLILKTFSELLKKFKLSSDKLLTFIATKPKIQYGKQVFFSYIKQSKSLEVYPDNLLQYLANKKRNEFNDAKMPEYINGVVIPLLIHSLLHEIAHSKEPQDISFLKKFGWSWSEETVNSKYLVSYREKSKNLDKILKEITFNKLGYNDWLVQNQLYISSVNNLLKEKLSEKEFKKKARNLKWFTETDKSDKQFQLSFLVSQNLPSIYALSSPKEWFAEVYAGCLFVKLYPHALKASEAIRFELLLGFNPKAMHGSFCQ